MKFVAIFGPPAVGKMTVGQELAALTGLKLFHNHMTIDLVSHFFGYGSPTGKRLVKLFRREIFAAVAAGDGPGLIFTYVWAFDQPEDRAYIEEVGALFEERGGAVYWVELTAPLDERLERNRHPNRLAHKWTKRDLAASEQLLRADQETYRLNSLPGEIARENYLRLDNTRLPADACAREIVRHFGW